MNGSILVELVLFLGVIIWSILEYFGYFWSIAPYLILSKYEWFKIGNVLELGSDIDIVILWSVHKFDVN